jgi:hypothetical protein
LAETPFSLASTLVAPSEAPDFRSGKRNVEDDAISVLPSPNRPRTEALTLKPDDLSSARADRSPAMQLAEIITPAMSRALEQCFGKAGPMIAGMADAAQSLPTELSARVAEALHGAFEDFSSSHTDAIRLASNAIVLEQKVIAEKLDGLLAVLPGNDEPQVEILRQLANESKELAPRIETASREALAELAKRQDVEAKRVTELIESMQAYAASLLPAIRRLESFDERLVRAMNQESETMSLLHVSINELSGMLEALRVQLGHSSNRRMPERLNIPGGQEGENGLRNGQSNIHNLAAELRAVLDDLDEDSQPDQRNRG